MLCIGEELTRRNLLGHLKFPEGTLGLGSCILGALAGLRKFGRLLLRITLQGLVLLDGVLELLLNLADPGLVLLTRSAFLGRFIVGFG